MIHVPRVGAAMKLHELAATGALVGTMLALAAAASAVVFDPLRSDLRFNLGGLPPISMLNEGGCCGSGTVWMYNNGPGHDLTYSPSIWQASGIAVETALLTGVSYLSRLTLTVANDGGSFTASYVGFNWVGGNLPAPTSTPYSGVLCPDGCLGGLGTLNGQFILTLLGVPYPFPLNVVGIGDAMTLPFGTGAIAVTGGAWITGQARITNISTNVISMPGRGAGITGIGLTLEPNGTEEIRTFTTLGGFVNSHPTGVVETEASVTVSGTNDLLSANAIDRSQVTLVSPMRIDTGPLGVGRLPGQVAMTLAFLPEPVSDLLMISGTLGLVILGRRRMRRRAVATREDR